MPTRRPSADTLGGMTEGDTPAASPTPAEVGGHDSLSDIIVPMEPSEIIDRLSQSARRGNLPEFAPGGPENALFRASALGHPFDRDLLAWAEPVDAGTRLRFGLRWRPQTPAIYAAAMILTVEPGRYFLELMIPGSWGWGSIMWWYYPLTILPIMPSWLYFVRKSRQTTLETARKSHEAIGAVLRHAARG